VRSIEDVQEVVRIIRDDTWKKIKKLQKELNEYETG
jgi:ribosome recycling factor